MSNENFADMYIKEMKENPNFTKMTWDDLFDKWNIPKNERSDFLVACILAQAQEKLGHPKPEKPEVMKKLDKICEEGFGNV